MRFKIANSWFGKLGQILASFLVVGLVVLWLAHRAHAQAPKADGADTPTAGVANVTREDLFKQVTIAAEFRPYVEVALPAKVTGYIGKMNVDFGDTVKSKKFLGMV